MSLDRMNWEKTTKKSSGDVVTNEIDPVKTAEAIAINSGLSNIGGTGLSGAAYVASRGGVNAQGYYNDVPAYQQLTANERASVTLSNGHINTQAMLDILNRKEREYLGDIRYNRIYGITDAQNSSSASLVATPPAPEPVAFMLASSAPAPIKTATPDIILFDDESVPIDTMSDLIFENIGGQELINITRSDIINGQKISYQPIKNLSSIQQRYNSNNILSLQQTADKYFSGFSIKLEDKIPYEGNGINGENIYIDQTTGDLIIEFVNIGIDEQIETQITVSGTIYEMNLGDYVS